MKLLNRAVICTACLLTASVYASPASIAERLYSKYGTIETVKGPLDRAKQSDMVRQWIAGYAMDKHPLDAMERMIRSGYSMNASEIRRFGCEKQYFGGYKCTDLQKGHGFMMLNGKKQATSGDLCVPMPPGFAEQMMSVGGSRLLSFFLDLQVSAYNEQSKLFAFRRAGDDICAEFDV